MQTEQTIPVSGMHCASCASIIERSLRKLPGVNQASVSYATEKATVDFDSKTVSLQKMNSEIAKYGYRLEVPDLLTDQKKIPRPENEVTGPDKRPIAAFVMALVIFTLMLWEILSDSIAGFPEIPLNMQTRVWLFFITATLSLFGFGSQFLLAVGRFIRYGKANMDTLVGIGTGVAYLYSTTLLLTSVRNGSFAPGNNYYFDATVVVIGFVMFGKYLESASKRKTGEALEKLIGLSVKTAIIKDGKGEREIPISDVKAGDTVIVKPGTKIPIDGRVTYGASAVDVSMITGEPIPRDINSGMRVTGGTMNLNGVLYVKAEKVGKFTLLAQIIDMVEKAQSTKAPVERLADGIAAVFVPVVLVISVLSFLSWIVIGGIYLPYPMAFSQAIKAMVGVLVIACPCALGLATPTAIIAGVGRGAANGILIKDAEALEIFHKVRAVVFDKTGTITRGKPDVSDVMVSGKNTEKEVIRILASLEQHSEHPLATAIMTKAKAMSIEPEKATDFKSISGMGLEGTVGGIKYHAGNAALMHSIGVKPEDYIKKDLSGQGKTPVFISGGGILIGTVYISDTIKDGAKEEITKLKSMGVKPVLLSGDDKMAVSYIAKIAGIDQYRGGVSPIDKGRFITDLKKTYQMVAMVGDGINDAPALALADVGIAMGTGTDVAISTAQITLLHGDIRKIYDAIALAKKTMTVVRENLFWAFFYNIIGIPLAAGLFYPLTGWTLHPAFAGMAMALSSVSVVGNSLRLKKMRI